MKASKQRPTCGIIISAIVALVATSLSIKAAQSFDWVDSGRMGDYPDSDRSYWCRSAIPPADECNAASVDTVAVCWQGLPGRSCGQQSSWCALKTVGLDAGKATNPESVPGRIWVCRR